MKKIQFNKKLFDPLFHSQILFIFGDESYAENKIKRDYDINENFSDYAGSVDTYKLGAIHQFILYINADNWKYKIDNYALLSHEIFHLVFRILEYKNSEKEFAIKESMNETTAYLIDNIYSMVLKEITKKIKYK